MSGLLRTQKNDVFKALADNNLNPVDFSWDTCNPGKSSVWAQAEILRTGDFYFKFDRHINNSSQHVYAIELFPNLNLLKHSETLSPWHGNTKSVMIWVHAWVSVVSQQINAPDLWAQLKTESDRFQIADSAVEDIPFSFQDVQEIKERIDLLSQEIKKIPELTEETYKEIEQKLEHLKNTVETQGKKGWLYTAVGVAFTIAVGLPEDVKAAIGTIFMTVLFEPINYILGNAIKMIT